MAGVNWDAKKMTCKSCLKKHWRKGGTDVAGEEGGMNNKKNLPGKSSTKDQTCGKLKADGKETEKGVERE